MSPDETVGRVLWLPLSRDDHLRPLLGGEGQLLIGAWRQADAGGAVLVVACVPEPLQRILQMTGADQVLRVYDTVTDAEAVFGS